MKLGDFKCENFGQHAFGFSHQGIIILLVIVTLFVGGVFDDNYSHKT